MIAATLVSCCGQKLDSAAPAQRLYCSQWFNKAKAYAVSKRRPWFILSARYGLVSPDQLIEPYNRRLDELKPAQRIAWARVIAHELFPQLGQFARVELLAGVDYRKHLVGELERRQVQVDVPMAGLGIGEQLQWLGANL
jgi:hypothetical protein